MSNYYFMRKDDGTFDVWDVDGSGLQEWRDSNPDWTPLRPADPGEVARYVERALPATYTPDEDIYGVYDIGNTVNYGSGSSTPTGNAAGSVIAPFTAAETGNSAVDHGGVVLWDGYGEIFDQIEGIDPEVAYEQQYGKSLGSALDASTKDRGFFDRVGSGLDGVDLNPFDEIGDMMGMMMSMMPMMMMMGMMNMMPRTRR